MSTDNSQMVFHVGPWKTGSTYLQKYVFPRLTNVEVLWNPSLLAMLRARVRGGRLLLTSEDFSGVPYGQDYASRRNAMIKHLSDSFPGSSVMVVLRDPATMIPSLYFQYVKRGGSRPFDEFFDEKVDVSAFRYAPFLEEMERYSFNRVAVSFFEDLFGDDKRPEQVLEVFDDWEYEAPSQSLGSATNVSLKRNGARILRAVNRAAFNMGMGTRDWVPHLNKYWLRRLGIAPARLLQSRPLRWIDRTGVSLVEENWPPLLDELSGEYQEIKRERAGSS
ncbi:MULTISPECIES: hypothetical protein [unclassified Thioalkalivibrio]|uniref:hypothetical protein n=1 Tax=unclassified Thioalkalivibrio TaxID=2621013 RepID=UPI001E4CE067|nr:MULTISPECIES: hypothetical protein [unclassified Thioalkalivibrio]